MILNLVETIREVAKSVHTDEFMVLRLEEELLANLVKNSNQPTSEKKKAFARMEVINRLQLQMVGSTLK